MTRSNFNTLETTPGSRAGSRVGFSRDSSPLRLESLEGQSHVGASSLLHVHDRSTSNKELFLDNGGSGTHLDMAWALAESERETQISHQKALAESEAQLAASAAEVLYVKG